MRFIYIFLFINFLISKKSLAQFTFILSDSVEVFIGDKRLEYAWAGGLNSVQINTIDLDNDGYEDLVVFDKSTSKFSTFLNKGNTYEYNPYFDATFPEINFWVLLRDYDGDGAKDMFTWAPAGIRVFKNKGFTTNGLQWELVEQTIFTKGQSGFRINLKVDNTDIPAIVDVDNDGDLDIFNFVPSLGGSIEFNKNLSIETYGNADSLLFEKVTDRWGGLVECGNCQNYFFDGGASCRTAAVNHAGSALLLFDKDNDGDQDLLLGEVDCTSLVQVTNEGSPESVLFSDFQSSYPTSEPVDILFPAAFYEDVDFDGEKELLVSPNLIANESRMTDFASSIWLYNNNSFGNEADFSLAKHNFLQDEMIELGEGTTPAVADEDGDGDLDLFIANKGRVHEDGFYSTITLFENTGTDKSPSFLLKDKDYLGLSRFRYTELKIQFADINNDGLSDLIYTALQIGSEPSIRYLLNLSSTSMSSLSFSINQINRLNLPIERLDEVHMVDIDNDNDQDVLVGKFKGGELFFYENLGNLTFAQSINGFGGINFDNLRLELSLETADMDGDGKLELITGDKAGNLRIYPFFQDELKGQFTAIGDTIYNPVTKRFIDYNFGSGVFPTVFGKDIILGSEAGGVMYLQNINDIVSSTEEKDVKIDILIFPNPSKGYVIINTPEAANMGIYTVQGEKIKDDFQLIPRIDNIITLSSYPKGIYLMKISNPKGVVSKKLLID